MIGWLRGRVLDRQATRLLLRVGDVGYELQVTVNNRAHVGAELELHVHTHVREDALQLFGFDDPQEKQLFDLLLGVQGIGPTKAIQLLQSPVADLVQAITGRDVARLSKLPGVGKKTAERILVDLADKLVGFGLPQAGPVRTEIPRRSDLESALLNLGFKGDRVEAIAAELVQARPDAALPELLRHALARLTDGRAKSEG
ncbi:MAG: Holliday junction branch migration protein RuvA [Myxococcota bacterium]